MRGRTLVKILNLVFLLTLGFLALLYFKIIPLPRSLDPFAPIDLAAPPNLLTGLKLRAIADDVPACVAALREVNVPVRVMPLRQEGPSCERRDTIELSKLSRASLAPLETRCDLALRLYLFERHVAQPASQRFFGAAIERIDHFGSYSCRDIRGRAGTRSEHATANAVDLAGFRLAGGREITLKSDWRIAGPTGQFLRELRNGACDWFNLVLSPDYNAAHEDHLHFDMGWYSSCR